MQFDPSRIVSLHNHTSFSLLDGLSTPSDIVNLAVERGQSAAAMTDHGNITGIAEFYHKCKDAGIKPILGEEFYICPNGRKLTDRDPQQDRRRHHITIIAKNEAGYKNLCWLSSEAKINGDYYKPRIDYPTLFAHKEGLIVLSGCIVSQLNYFVESYLGNNGEKDAEGLSKARAYLKRMKEEFGDDFYIEQVWLRPTGKVNTYDKSRAEEEGKKYKSIIDRQNEANEITKQLAKEFGIKRVMTGDAHYARPEDKESHETLICIGTASDKNDPNRLTFIDQDLSIPSAEAMYNHAKELNDLELVETQGEIIDKVTLDLKLGEQGNRVPKFPVPEGIVFEGKEIKSEADYLRYLTFEGYKKKNYAEKWKDKLDVVHAEIKKELEVIDKMGFNGYFLIVQEYCNWARANGVLVGPGRGSAAGSVVVYLIGITSIDPMEYPDLMIFERFLNPDRYSMPDIDMDFSDRQKVEDHLVELYGRDHVCAIQTISRMRAKNAFKDVARTEKFDYMESNRIANLIPDLAGEAAKTNRLSREVSENQDLKDAIEKDETGQLAHIFDEAITLEGNVRGYGVHAAGVIISDKPLTDYIGLFTSNDKRIVQQSDSTQVEPDYGLLKMDLLGLANLTVMNECIRSIKKKNSSFPYNTPDDLPTDDKKTFELIGEGRSNFTFQFNSTLMRTAAKRLKPESIKDLALLVAVVRPGPLQFLDEIIAVKNGAKGRQVIYWDEKNKVKANGPGNGIVKLTPIEVSEPKIKAIVDQTYGHVVYQEQLMKICTTCCGFTMGEADKVRKAMGKSKPSELAKYRPHFIKGFLENTDSTKELEISIFWDELLELAKYCFNGSHSVCYATIGYQTAYLLTHYPAEYLAAYMNIKKDDKDELGSVEAYCRDREIPITAPDLKTPGLEFTPGTNKIAYGLTSIKGVNSTAAKIVDAMSTEDAPQTLEEILSTFDKKTMNARVLTALIYSGALDSYVDKELIEKDRFKGILGARDILINNIEAIQEFRDKALKPKKVHKKQASLLAELFPEEDHLQLKANEIPFDNNLQKKKEVLKILVKEREMLGSFITYNPLKMFTSKDQVNGEGKTVSWESLYLSFLKMIREYRTKHPECTRDGFLSRDDLKNAIKEAGKTYKDSSLKGVVGRIVKHRETVTKKGDKMYFLQVEFLGPDTGETYQFEVTAFPDAASMIKNDIKEKFFYEFSGFLEEEGNLIANEIRALAF